MDEFWELAFWEMTLRTVLSFVVLLILARFMGKKQVSQLTFFHYVTGITIGSIAANLAGESETPFLNGLYGMILWAVLTIVANYLSFKSIKLRVLLDDKPMIVIENGEIIEGSLRKLRLSFNDLNMLLREKSIFSMKEVNYAIFETNGNLSVMLKTGEEPATKKDVQASSPPPKYIPTEIITNGKVEEKNMRELKLTDVWLTKQLEQQGIARPEQVLYAEIQTDGSLYVNTLKSV
ncbi:MULTISPECIES: YetF domain-containing protein [Sporosarcina]|uniref:YetF domain-containing protein n=1 Tax=Sporosarcina TaxID=1569 RepID=UPI0035E45E66